MNKNKNNAIAVAKLNQWYAHENIDFKSTWDEEDQIDITIDGNLYVVNPYSNPHFHFLFTEGELGIIKPDLLKNLYKAFGFTWKNTKKQISHNFRIGFIERINNKAVRHHLLLKLDDNHHRIVAIDFDGDYSEKIGYIDLNTGEWTTLIYYMSPTKMDLLIDEIIPMIRNEMI